MEANDGSLSMSRDTAEDDMVDALASEDGIESTEETGKKKVDIEVAAVSQGKEGEAAVGRGRKKSISACPRPKKLRRIADLQTVEPMISGSSKGKAVMTSKNTVTTSILNKGKAAMVSSNGSKTVANPTSKFMASSFKALKATESSNNSKAIVLGNLTKPAKGINCIFNEPCYLIIPCINCILWSFRSDFQFI